MSEETNHGIESAVMENEHESVPPNAMNKGVWWDVFLRWMVMNA